MKLSLCPTNVPAVNPGEDISQKVSLEKMDGKFVSPLKIVYKAATANQSAFEAQTEIDITAKAEAGGSGTRRVMFKVDLPYQGLYPANQADGATMSTFSPARSGRKMSAHVVFTIPKDAVDDITKQRAGAEGYTLAVQQLYTIQLLLNSLVRSAINGGLKNVDAYESGLVQSMDANTPTYDEQSNTLDLTKIRNAMKDQQAPTAEVEFYPISISKSPLLRGISGLNPFPDEAVVGYKALSVSI